MADSQSAFGFVPDWLLLRFPSHLLLRLGLVKATYGSASLALDEELQLYNAGDSEVHGIQT